MYPELPNSLADLTTHPPCDGPKLSPFKFHGDVQNIKFLEKIGQGLHSYVFKVEIGNKLYALKLFSFPYDNDWYGNTAIHEDDNEGIAAVGQYCDPFNAECRAYGRLQEAHQEELAVKCYGYILLDEAHERAVCDRFSEHVPLSFNGTPDGTDDWDVRSRFTGRRAPVRGIVKELGQPVQKLTVSLLRSIERDMIKIQQLGIISLDMHFQQIIDGKLGDFSKALTTPHFAITPQLNPKLSAQEIQMLTYETFRMCLEDFWDIDDMVQAWNDDNRGHPEAQVKFWCIRPQRHQHDLRQTKSRDALYTFVDPRAYNWRVSFPANTAAINGSPTNGSSSNGMSSISTTTGRWRPPKKWYVDMNVNRIRYLRKNGPCLARISWKCVNGHIYPSSEFLTQIDEGKRTS